MKKISLIFSLVCAMIISTNIGAQNLELSLKKKGSYLYKSEKVSLTKLLGSKIEKSSKNVFKSDDYIHAEFETSFYIPSDMSDVQLENYIKKNLKSINGVIRYMINDREFVTVKIVNGVGESSLNYTTEGYPCTYSGIQDCVQHAVYEEWSTYTALKCAFTGGLACIADEAASCIEENCL